MHGQQNVKFAIKILAFLFDHGREKSLEAVAY
jgi:hypothetical protein